MIAAALLLVSVVAQPLIGDWDGALTVPAGIKVPLILHLKESGSTIDSPDQNSVKIVELPGLNHLLQPATTGLPAEYGQIATTVDPQALDLIVGWVTAIVR